MKMSSRLSQATLRIVQRVAQNPSMSQLRSISKWDSANENSSDGNPVKQRLAKRSKALTEEIDQSIAEFNDFNPIRATTKHYKHVNYRDGDEDNIPEINWEFYSSLIRDPEVIPALKSAYENVLKDLDKMDANPDISTLHDLERYLDKSYNYINDFVKPTEQLLRDVSDDVDRIDDYQQNLKDMTAEELFAREPKILEAVKSDWDNNRWGVKNDHPEA